MVIRLLVFNIYEEEDKNFSITVWRAGLNAGGENFSRAGN